MQDAFPHLVGFVVVLCTLTVLWMLCALIGKVAGCLPNKEASPPSVPKQQPVETSPQQEEIASEVLAIIAAAVATTSTTPQRIVSVAPYNPAWQQAGRFSVQNSHSLR